MRNKSEIRNPKQYPNSKKKAQNSKRLVSVIGILAIRICFGFRISDLFRISDFGFRICFGFRISDLEKINMSRKSLTAICGVFVFTVVLAVNAARPQQRPEAAADPVRQRLDDLQEALNFTQQALARSVD